jgi:nitrogen-specific signal transduction histidine kinase/ActR/RegA family two-component response regulator
VEESSTPIRGQKGAIIGATLVLRDVTARREIQDQVNQSQKMDAVGRLASGVAGGFNDLLTVITGYSEMIRSDLDPTDHRWRFADEICTAAGRAAGLTRQLTALGNKEPGPMRVQELHSLVTSMEPVLKRLLGDKVNLVVVPGSGRVKVDPAQIEQVIWNLAMNSRDAMPNGGKFVIEISSMELAAGQTDPWPGLKPGSYVTLAVSDTGTGMDAETRAHLFEPFFTTKSRGKGAGLGLSVVYGIIQQCGGYINVYSQLGSGTIIEIFLPREKGSAEIVVPQSRRSKRGSETVLIVDDEEGVRKLVHAVLVSNGYKVLEARDGTEALSIFEANRDKVKIVVTDVVMPTMSGVDLGDRLHRINPTLRILYISGFRDTPLGITAPEPDRAFLSKPFTPAAFLTAVRELLDGIATERLPGT